MQMTPYQVFLSPIVASQIPMGKRNLMPSVLSTLGLSRSHTHTHASRVGASLSPSVQRGPMPNFEREKKTEIVVRRVWVWCRQNLKTSSSLL